MTQEKWQDTLVSIKNKVCTARNAKIAVAFCIVCVVATAGGHYYLHQQHLARHAERVDAMVQMTKAQADQHNISLISEDQACAAAGATAKAAADGQAYKQVVPMTPHQGQPDRNGQPPQGAMPQNAFHPMYKVRVTSGSVRYDVLVDATNGTVIHTEIED